MKLVKQAKLFFREGNSDKVYEIDLCEIDSTHYVVNFRYGRRGASLKEGTKTEFVVDRGKAEAIFNSLRDEKLGKGYIMSDGEALTPVAITAIPTVSIPEIDWSTKPAGRERAVLKRLKDAVDGKTNTKIPWKLSRIIWMAGVLKIKEAVPYVYQLALKGDSMQQYAAAWALGRMGNPEVIPLLKNLTKSSVAGVKRIAGEAFLQLSTGEERSQLIQYHINSLAEPFKLAIIASDAPGLEQLLQERVLGQTQPEYNILEHLYIISVQEKWIRDILKQLLTNLPSRPGYFKHIRHIFKASEFRDDFEILGLLAVKFEREPEMFSHNPFDDDDKTYVQSLNAFINTTGELKKKSSTLAYSNKTRQYFRNRVRRSLNNYGKYADIDYVRMATGILLGYHDKTDHRPAYATNNYVWSSGRYVTEVLQFPANAHATLLHQVMSGNDPGYQLNHNTWQLIDPQVKKTGKVPATPANSGGLFKKIISLFGGKKGEPPAETVVNEPAVVHPTPYINLWNQLPQAYIQLLVSARMEEVHAFALGNLEKHPEYTGVEAKIDHYVLGRMLQSEYDIPANYAFNLARKRYDPHHPDTDLVQAILASRVLAARELGKQWVMTNPRIFFDDTEWVTTALFNSYSDIRDWIGSQMQDHIYTPVQAELICGRTISKALTWRYNTKENNEIISGATSIIIKLFADQLASVSAAVTEDLIKSPLSAVQLLGLQVLLLKKDTVDYDTISSSALMVLLQNESEAVRETTLQLLLQLSTEELLKRQELVVACTHSAFSNIRTGIRPVLQKMIKQNPSFGTMLVDFLIPFLLKKENAGGQHKDISDTLQTVLMDSINQADKTLVLKLVYSDYLPAQEFGIAILDKYIDPAGFSLRQIIGLGNHETLLVREWCWNYFRNHIPRIKYEREESIRLLDAKWDDTREFAKSFFTEQFTDADWSPEILVGLADSVRPDIEAFGRMLITKFFKDESGMEYLGKLSQHPSIKMQLFATNYLEKFAADDITKLEQLDFYFRSVLTRVNKARTAKNRIFRFLLAEGTKSEQAAGLVVRLITNVSATVSVEDKAKCIEILLVLQKMYNVEIPMMVKPVAVKD